MPSSSKNRPSFRAADKALSRVFDVAVIAPGSSTVGLCSAVAEIIDQETGVLQMQTALRLVANDPAAGNLMGVTLSSVHAAMSAADGGTPTTFEQVVDTLRTLASASARIVEDDSAPTAMHMRELDRRRAAASALLDNLDGRFLTVAPPTGG